MHYLFCEKCITFILLVKATQATTFLYFRRQYAVNLCGVANDCAHLTVGDYVSQYEIYTLFIGCFFHAALWFVVLRVVDIVKDGGNPKDAFNMFRVSLIVR